MALGIAALVLLLVRLKVDVILEGQSYLLAVFDARLASVLCTWGASVGGDGHGGDHDVEKDRRDAILI
jgi:hypothetical protein